MNVSTAAALGLSSLEAVTGARSLRLDQESVMLAKEGLSFAEQEWGSLVAVLCVTDVLHPQARSEQGGAQLRPSRAQDSKEGAAAYKHSTDGAGTERRAG